jgi:sugar/nucleoside kinase (ribokinase family)
VTEPGVTEGEFDLLATGQPSVDVMFSGLSAWPELGRDVDAEDLGVCAGTSFNTPAAANRLGLRVGYIAMIGNDIWSHIVRDEFTSESLPTDFLRLADRPMPFVSVALNRDSERGFVTYAATEKRDDEELHRYAIEVVTNAAARHLHVYAGEEPSELATIARERGMTISMDAWGGPWWEEPAPLEELLPRGDVLFANEPEALAMTGEPDVRGAMERMADLCGCVVIKRGPRGSMGSAGGEVREAPAERARVVDTTGAGDCFNAGFLSGWLAKLPLEDCLTLGNICGARSVEEFGGYRGCPKGPELHEIAAARGISLP